MNDKPRVIPALVATALLAFAGCATSPRALATWEYRIIRDAPYTPEFQEKLNQAGSEGFTIDSTTLVPGGEHGDVRSEHQVLVILKRARR